MCTQVELNKADDSMNTDGELYIKWKATRPCMYC